MELEVPLGLDLDKMSPGRVSMLKNCFREECNKCPNGVYGDKMSPGRISMLENCINDMKLPICSGAYSNEIDVPAVEFLGDVQVTLHSFLEYFQTFFVGMCFYCNEKGSNKPLKRCGGCQLVGYCSRNCQKLDRPSHKLVCLVFPVVNGNNVFYTTGSWKEHIAGLREQAARLPNTDFTAKPIFRNPRVCNTCCESRPAQLTDCKCACISYCSEKCSIADKKHKKDCKHLCHISNIHHLRYRQPKEYMKDISACKKFTPALSWSDIVSRAFTLTSKVIGTSVIDMYSLLIECFSFPMSLLYALQMVPGCHIGQKPLKNLTTLTVHVVTSSPLFDTESWEAFLHRFPKLKQMKIVFVVQGKGFKQSFFLNTKLSLKRCKECEVKNRIITYSVQQMQYHMFFSAADYTEPDVVIVYGNKHEMSLDENSDIHSEISYHNRTYKGDIHSDISYRNMTYSSNTIVVLTDATVDLVKKGVRAVNSAHPVEQLVKPQVNPFRGFSLNRATMDSDVAVINEKYYFTCLRKK